MPNPTASRIRLSRAKGWRLPEGAVIVDRRTAWGNPFVVGRDGTRAECVDLHRHLLAGYLCLTSHATAQEQMAARDYVFAHIRELIGRDLACWCGPGPCHANTLLECAAVVERADG